jgi:hypothetical protein
MIKRHPNSSPYDASGLPRSDQTLNPVQYRSGRKPIAEDTRIQNVVNRWRDSYKNADDAIMSELKQILGGRLSEKVQFYETGYIRINGVMYEPPE